jgi:transketolase
MRDAFIKTLEEEAEKDDSIVILTADMGFSVLEGFERKYPERFFNVGIAEQNMIGIAAGLALTDKKVFVYSMIPFITFRCLEQIRNDICYHELGVVLVGIGSGISYGTMGFSHHAIEDVGVLKSIPNLTILAPSDPNEVKQLVKESLKYPRPIYMRLGKNGERRFNEDSDSIRLGKAHHLIKGSDIALITYGNILECVVEAHERLRLEGITASLVTTPTIKPIDEDFFIKLFKTHKYIFIIEEHNMIGGLGETLFRVNKNNPHNVLMTHIAIDDKFICEVGSSKHIRKTIGLDADTITRTVLDTIGKIR